MEPSNSSSLIIFFIANYFFTFLIIGLIAAGISLLNKPEPLRINTVAEAFFSSSISCSMFSSEMAAKFIGWEDKPVSGRGGIRQSGCGHCGTQAVQGELAFPLRYAHSAFSFLVSSRRRSHLPDNRGAQFFAGECRIGSCRVIFSFQLPGLCSRGCRTNIRSLERRIRD